MFRRRRRRIQCAVGSTGFFQAVRLSDTEIARIIVTFLHLDGKPWVLAMDRTNWKLGKTTINILMLSVVWRGQGFPLFWSLLPSEGNSKATARTELLDRLLETFPDVKIAALTGDREFIGEAWMRWLDAHKVPFVLRLRENQFVRRDGFSPVLLSTLAQGLKVGTPRILKEKCQFGQAEEAGDIAVRLVLLRLKSGELLALACSSRPARALAMYRMRWTIETLFSNIKTRGLNLEATHLTDPEKLATLVGILAISVMLTAKAGDLAEQAAPIPIKKHGYKARATFAKGLDTLRNLLARPPTAPIPKEIIKLFPKHTLNLCPKQMHCLERV